MPSRRDEIAKEARQILDKFAKELSKVKTTESFVEREKDVRIEGGGIDGDISFREIFFQNAPDVKNDYIQGEKGKWK